MRRWIIRSCSATETSRCCAPSWRLRSSRRRSASPAATMRSREARSSASRSSDSACSRASSSAIAAVAATAPDELRIVVERRVVDEHPQLAAVALDRRRGPVAARPGQLDRLSAAVDVGVLVRHAIGQHELRVAERLGEPRLQPHAAQRAELAEEVREPAAREPRAQQAPEQRGRDREQRPRSGPDMSSVDGDRDQRGEVRGVQHAGQAAAEARQQRRRRGREAERQRARSRPRRRATRRPGRPNWTLVSALRDVGVGPHEQQVALVGQEQHHRRTAGRRGRRRTSRRAPRRRST